MKAIDFKESNCVFGKGQPEYLPLPAFRSKEGEVISIWKPTLKERFQILFGANIGLSLFTFNQPIQPQRLFIVHFEEIKTEKIMKVVEPAGPRHPGKPPKHKPVG